MKCSRMVLWAIPLALTLTVGGCSSNDNTTDPALVVTSLDDVAAPPAGTVTLRSALEAAASGDTITFDSSLDGDTIVLTIIADEHTVLQGEVYVNNAFAGYQERDYGKSALYARKNVKIDASDLPNGITVRWGGGGASHARVLAVYGDLTMWNVTIESGYSQTEAIAAGTQPTRWPGAADWRSGARPSSTIAPSSGTPARAKRRPPGTAARTAAASTPTGSTSTTASSAATWPPPTAPGAGASIPSAARTGRAATATTRP